MQVANIQRIDEIIAFHEKLIRFTGKTSDHIHTYTAIRDQFFNTLYPLTVKFPLIAPAHQAQYFIGAGLQEYMEMGNKPFGLCYKLYGLILQQVGLNG